MNNVTKTLAVFAVLAFLGAGCSRQSAGSNANIPDVGTSQGNIANGAFTVKIQSDGEFDPITAFVKKDTVLTFENDSQNAHSIIPQKDAGKEFAGLDSKGDIAAGGKFSVTMDQVGRWLYSDGTNPAFGGAIEVME